MFKGVLALTATAAISLAVVANSASAEDLTKFYSTERVSGYKSGEFMILAEDDVNFRSNPAVSNNIISCLPRHSLLRITTSSPGLKPYGTGIRAILQPNI